LKEIAQFGDGSGDFSTEVAEVGGGGFTSAMSLGSGIGAKLGNLATDVMIEAFEASVQARELGWQRVG
jgi:hypothetical protein